MKKKKIPWDLHVRGVHLFALPVHHKTALALEWLNCLESHIPILKDGLGSLPFQNRIMGFISPTSMKDKV